MDRPTSRCGRRHLGMPRLCRRWERSTGDRLRRGYQQGARFLSPARAGRTSSGQVRFLNPMDRFTKGATLPEPVQGPPRRGRPPANPVERLQLTDAERSSQRYSPLVGGDKRRVGGSPLHPQPYSDHRRSRR